MKTIEVKFSEVSKIITCAFPGAKSRRTVKIEGRDTYNVRDYWDGGSRYECRFIHLSSLRVMSSNEIPYGVRQQVNNPYNQPMCDVNVTFGYCVVEHVIFCGKDLGYRIYVSKERFSAIEGNGVGELTTSEESARLLPTIPAPALNEKCDTIPCPPPSTPCQ